MAGKHLTIIVRAAGLSGVVYGVSGKQAVPESSCSLLFEDLEADNDGQGLFESALHALSREMDVSDCTRAVLLLDAGFCFFRNTRLPFKSRKKAGQVLPFELSSGFPEENEPFLTDFSIQDIEPDNGDYMVFSASAREELVREYADSLKQAGIRPSVIVPECLALVSSYLKMQKQMEDFLFLVPCETGMTAVMVIRRKPVFVRTFPLAHDSPVVVDTELNRMILGFWQTYRIIAAFHIVVVRSGQVSLEETVLFEHLEKTVSFQSRIKNREPEEASDARLKIEQVAVEPLLSDVSPERNILGAFNFWTGRYGADSFFKSNFKHIVTSSVLALLVFAAMMVSVYMQIDVFEKKIAAKKQIGAAIFKETFPEKKAGNIDPLLVMQAEIKSAEKNGGLKRNDVLPAARTGAVDLLYELSRQIPGSIDVDVSRLVLDRERLILSGSTQNFKAVDLLKGHIETSDMFKSVEISSAASRKGGKRVEFKFIVEMVK